MKRFVGRFGIVAAAVVAMVLGSMAPAMAFDGTNWSSNPTLCRSGCTSNYNLIRFWQSVLWADDIGYQTGYASFIDGGFGPKTDAATRRWQTYFGLGADGRVGPITWGTAQTYGGGEFNHGTSICEPEGSKTRCRYNGDGRHFMWGFNNSNPPTGWYFEHPNNPNTRIYIS